MLGEHLLVGNDLRLTIAGVCSRNQNDIADRDATVYGNRHVYSSPDPKRNVKLVPTFPGSKVESLIVIRLFVELPGGNTGKVIIRIGLCNLPHDSTESHRKREKSRCKRPFNFHTSLFLFVCAPLLKLATLDAEMKSGMKKDQSECFPR